MCDARDRLAQRRIFSAGLLDAAYPTVVVTLLSFADVADGASINAPRRSWTPL
jgi:hypothetical protein